MAWKIEIDGVDYTTAIHQAGGVSISLQLNGRSRATFQLLPEYSAERFDGVIIYEQDGVTPIFGGFILQRRMTGISGSAPEAVTECECVGIDAYLDWAILNLSWPTDPTLQDVLDDLVDALPASYGITLDATDYSGTTLAAFSWTNVRASDALRDLSDRLHLVYRVSPLGVLSLSLPGGVAAPVTITDADSHCREFTWTDGVEPPVSTIVLLCGPSQQLMFRTDIPTDGVSREFVIAGPPVVPGGEYDLTCWIIEDGYEMEPGSEDHYFFQLVERNVDTGTTYHALWVESTKTFSIDADYSETIDGCAIVAGVIPAGWRIRFGYLAQYPFTVRASASPVQLPEVEKVVQRADVLDLAQGQEIADGLLGQYGGETARSVEFDSWTPGWVPGQEASVNLATRDFVGTCAITAVEISLEENADFEDDETHWLYRVSATELTVYDGGYLAAWRRLLGGGEGAGAVVTAVESGDVISITGAPPIYYLGGSRFHAVQVPA